MRFACTMTLAAALLAVSADAQSSAGVVPIASDTEAAGVAGVTTPWEYEAAVQGRLVRTGEVFGSDTYGTTIIGAEEFEPLGDAQTAMSLLSGSFGNRYRTGGGNSSLNATVAVPNGAEIAGVTLWARDNNASSQVSWHMYETRMETREGLQIGTGATGLAFNSGDFAQFQPINPYTVGAFNKRVWLMVLLPVADPGIALNGVTVWWRRQVALPPATATFNDVPTTHPFFQFVEALNASGITAGTGGGNFSPDAPLTRGQMAVFLAKALGLHWPGY